MHWIRLHWKLLLRRFGCVDSFCKRCGVDVRDFVVDDATWERVEQTIPTYGGVKGVLCYDCFCDLCPSVGLLAYWRLQRME